MSSHMSDSNSSLQVDFPISFRLLYGYMSYIFDNCFSMFWRDLVYLFWLYFTHIWQPIYNVLSFKHFIWYDLSFCHTSHFAPGMWIFGFYSPLLIFSKLCLKLREQTICGTNISNIEISRHSFGCHYSWNVLSKLDENRLNLFTL